MANGRRQAKRFEIARRRQRVAGELLRDETLTAIAEAEGVSVPTISRDVSAIKAEWRKAASADYHELVGRELAILGKMDRQCDDQIDGLLALAWRTDRNGKMIVNAEALGLAREWLGERRQLRGRVAALLGLNKSPRREVGGIPAEAGGVPIEITWRELPDDTEAKRQAARFLADSGVLTHDESEDDPDDAVPVG